MELGWLRRKHPQILDASLFAADNQVTLVLGGMLDGEILDDLYCTVSITAGSMVASRSDGVPFSLEQLVAMGERYWDGKRSKPRTGESAQ